MEVRDLARARFAVLNPEHLLTTRSIRATDRAPPRGCAVPGTR